MWTIIVNPASANGSTGRRWPRTQQVLRSMLPPFRSYLTEGPGHAERLAHDAIDAGSEVLVVHGGDGTLNEVVNGYLKHPRHEETCLALLPHGTGSDFAKTLGIPRNPRKAALRLVSASERRFDVGLATFSAGGENQTQRYFVNMADIGFGGELVQYVDSHSKRLGGRLSFLRGLLATLVHYRNKPVRLSVDGDDAGERVVSSVIVGNGQYFGGGMWAAPTASPTDGWLDVVVIGDVSRREVIANLGRLYYGTLAEHPKVETLRARRLSVTSPDRLFVEMDGELCGTSPVAFEVIPGALRILV
ncbi:MAG: diacylglycerol kinase family lipid kinase [candidate division KSB1 bacterium]|nr:diacylglycerol kinase family lipid kinase [candidate division KSB1 bacterium]